MPLPSLDDAGVDPQARERSSSGSSTGSQSPVLRRSNKEVFIRSFVFQPELPIRIDYEAKGFKTEMVTKLVYMYTHEVCTTCTWKLYYNRRA